MVTINPSVSSSYSPVTSGTVSATSLSSVTLDEDKMDVSISKVDTITSSTVSILARQLSEAATRAENRVGQSKVYLLDPIAGDDYFVNKAQHDAEVPNSNNPELLARARQATGFVNDSDANPFKGLARDQLSLIAHDDDGSFTINERRAAWDEVQLTAPASPTAPKAASGNGRDLMLSRLFSNQEPSVSQPPFTQYNSTQSAFNFLNLDDRSLVSDMYAYAQAEGVDLFYVDRLAWTLGTYRHHSDGLTLRSVQDGYDLEGYRVIFKLKEEDVAITSRIQGGEAISSTRVDQGFLRYILNPEEGGFVDIGGLPFLEKMVSKFSSVGDKQPSLGSEFATYKYAKIEDHVVRTLDKNIRLPRSEALSGIVDGVWFLTEKGKVAGYAIDQATGLLSKSAETPDDKLLKPSILNVSTDTVPDNTLLEALADTREQPKTRWIWPGHLFNLMKNLKP